MKAISGLKGIYFFIILVSFSKILFQFFFPHEIRLWEDHDMAVNLLNTGDLFYLHDGTKNYTYQFPVYPFILSLLYKCFGVKPVAATVFNILLNAFSAILFFQLSQKIISSLSIESLKEKSKKISSIAVILFLLYPPVNYYALYHVHPFSENLFFLLLVLYVSLLYLEDKRFKVFIFFSFVLALAVLDRGTVIVAVIPFYIFFLQKNGFIKTFRIFFAVAFASFLLVTPWLLRNYKKDNFIGFESVSGKDMWKGTLTNSEGSNYLSDGKNYYSALSTAELDSLGKLSPSQQNHFFTDKISRSWHETPAQMVNLFLLKLKNFWWFRGSIGNELPDQFQLFITAYKFIYVVVLFLSGFFFISTFKNSFPYLIMLISLSIFQSLFYVETRHRIIIEPFLIFFAIAGIFIFFEKITLQKQFQK